MRGALAVLALSASLAAPAFAAINVNKTFTPDAVKAGSPSKVTFYFLNGNVADATSLAFTDALPAGMFVAPTPNAVTGCGGTLTAVAGDTSVTFSGGTIPKAVDTTPGHCELSFDVVVPNANVLINSVPVGEVTSSQGSNVQAAEATLNVTGLAPITGSKSFDPVVVHGYLPQGSTPIPAGAKSTVTIALTNPNGVALTSVAFTDYLPSTVHPTSPVPAGGLVVSPIPNESTTCGGTVTATPGATSVSLSGGTIPAFGSCLVKFDVIAEKPTVAASSSITNAIPANAVTTYEGPTNVSFSRQIQRLTGGSLGKAFSPSTIVNGDVTELTLTLRNYNSTPINNVGFTDTLPAGLKIANPAQDAFTNADCQSPTSTYGSGFSVTAAPDGTSIVVSGGTLKAAPTNGNPAQCTIRVKVTTVAGNTATSFKNVVLAGVWDATVPYAETSATLTVSPITGTKSFSPPSVFQGDTSVATIALRNTSGQALTAFGFNDNVQSTMGGAPGPITVESSPAPSNDCGMTATISADAKSISFAGGSLADGATCNVTFTVRTYGNTATGSRTNTIAANAVTGTPPTGPAVKNLSAISGTLTVVAPASASKSFSPNPVPMGTESQLTLTINRANNSPAWSGFTITDTLPAGYTITDRAPSPASTCVGTLDAPAGGSTISFTSSSTTVPANNSSCAIRVWVRTPATCVSPSNLCTDTNRIPPGGLQVTFQGGGGYSNLGNIDGQITRSSTYVTLTKSFEDPVVDLGGTSMMYLRIVNTAGNAINLTGVNLSDSLPAGLVVATQPAGWPKFSGTGCTLGTLVAVPDSSVVSLTNASVNALRTCTIEVLTKANAAGNLINQVPAYALQSTQLVTNLEPVAATITSTGLAALSVTKTDGVTDLKAGATTTYTIVVTNADLANVATVAGATFTDTPPAGMTFTDWSCAPSTGAVCTPNGTGPILDSVTIPKGGSITYTVHALLAADYAQGTVKNCAAITPPGTVIDIDMTDNEACDTNNVPRGFILKKTWVNGIVDDAISVTTTGLVNNASVASTSTGNNTTTGTQVFNLAGGTVTLPVETFSPGSQSNYTTTLSCTGVQLAGSTPPQQFTMPNADVVCTYTNARAGRKLTLRKVWVNAKEGDAISVTTTGLANNASVSSTADATGGNSTTGTPATNAAGGTVTLPVETFGPGSQGSYTTTLACEGATPSQGTPPATFTMPENDVTCTYTNTRGGYTVTLKKTWIDGKAGDAMTVSTQGLESNASVTSTSSGNNTDTGSPASNPPGATVTLPAETFTTGNASDYTTTVSCTGAQLSGNQPGATFTMPAGNVVCTYTNQLKRLEIVATPVCIKNAPWVSYTVTPIGFTPGANPVTWQWIDSTNAVRQTVTDQPLTGMLLWPGATVDSGGFATGWPGWQLVGSTWVPVNDGLRPTMTLVASVNPTLEVTVAYPPASAACEPPKKDPPPPSPPQAVPAGTPEGWLMLAALVALMGAWSARRRVNR